jgi:FtsZ-binding cell division protein ZapB
MTIQETISDIDKRSAYKVDDKLNVVDTVTMSKKEWKEIKEHIEKLESDVSWLREEIDAFEREQ